LNDHHFLGELVYLLYALLNIGITAGYIFVAFAVAPHFDLKRQWTIVAGMFFFVTCGLTHLEMAYHALLNSHHVTLSNFSLVNHTVQVIAVWAFVTGLYLEYVTDQAKQGLKILPPKTRTDLDKQST